MQGIEVNDGVTVTTRNVGLSTDYREAASVGNSGSLTKGTAPSDVDRRLNSLNEALFHIAVIGLGIYLAATGRLEFGAIVTFLLLFLACRSHLTRPVTLFSQISGTDISTATRYSPDKPS